MKTAVEYLRIPQEYGKRLGGLRWAQTGDAVVLANGETFALAPEIALFLSGFAGRARLVHFAYVLHALHWLAKGKGELAPPFVALRRAFADTGRRYRNAGALFARLMAGLPRTAALVDATEVALVLAGSVSAPAQIAFVASEEGPPPSAGGSRFPSDLVSDASEPDDPTDTRMVTEEDLEGTKAVLAAPDTTATKREHLSELLRAFVSVGQSRELPPVSFEAAEALVLGELAKLDAATVERWLRHGEPVAKEAGEAIAREVLTERPSLEDVLARAAERPRLSGSLPLVAQLASSLVLPPRRLAASELPLGGYSDVTTRGHLDQLLPTQLALDPDELVRRFAENELLYYRREEPRRRIREDLVILLDQGARTWGAVRVVLAAAALALGRRAGKKGVACFFASTSSEGHLLDPRVTEAALGELLEASDLSLAPAQALEKVLEQRAEGARDVVLLTHPRNLSEPDVLAAARRAAAPARLFAVTADEDGAIELAEVRHGGVLSLARLRVDLTPAAAPERPSSTSPDTAPGAWKGPVERVPFPFVFEPAGRLGKRAFDFDAANEWILIASRDGLLSAHRLDGSRAEVWPRARVNDAPLKEVDAVVGVPGGFVVCGRAGSKLVAVRYRIAERAVSLLDLDRPTAPTFVDWAYFPEHDSIAARWQEGKEMRVRVAELSGGVLGQIPPGPRLPSPRVRRLLELFERSEAPVPFPPDVIVGSPVHGAFVDAAGTLGVVAYGWRTFTPLQDGKPVLQGSQLGAAKLRGDVLAVTTWNPREWKLGSPVTLRLFRRDDRMLGEYELRSQNAGFQLSQDGALLARDVGNGRVEVRPTSGGAPLLVTRPGGYHNDVKLLLGDRWLALEVQGKILHFVRWDSSELHHYTLGTAARSGALEDYVRRELQGIPDVGLTGVLAQKAMLPAWTAVDRERFVAGASASLDAVLDRYGQVALFHHGGRLVAMLFARRAQLAVWLPDGTRLGPARLLGSPPSPDAPRKIARALQRASIRGRAPA